MSFTIHKAYRPGAIASIVQLHADYYSQRVGFGLPFELKVARELCDFCERYNAERDGLWLALREGRIEGAIALDGINAKQDGAHLRWFIVSDTLRGSGVGSSLLKAAKAFWEEKEYDRVYLWTFAGLESARHLYEKFGFRLVFQEPGSQWGAAVDEQRFEWVKNSDAR